MQQWTSPHTKTQQISAHPWQRYNTSNAKMTSKPPCTSSQSKKACRSGLRTECAKENNMKFSTLCSPEKDEKDSPSSVSKRHAQGSRGKLALPSSLRKNNSPRGPYLLQMFQLLAVVRVSTTSQGSRIRPHSFPAEPFTKFLQTLRVYFADFLTGCTEFLALGPNVDVTIPVKTFRAAILPHVSQVKRHATVCHRDIFREHHLENPPTRRQRQRHVNHKFQITTHLLQQVHPHSVPDIPPVSPKRPSGFCGGHPTSFNGFGFSSEFLFGDSDHIIILFHLGRLS